MDLKTASEINECRLPRCGAMQRGIYGRHGLYFFTTYLYASETPAQSLRIHFRICQCVTHFNYLLKTTFRIVMYAQAANSRGSTFSYWFLFRPKVYTIVKSQLARVSAVRYSKLLKCTYLNILKFEIQIARRLLYRDDLSAASPSFEYSLRVSTSRLGSSFFSSRSAKSMKFSQVLSTFNDFFPSVYCRHRGYWFNHVPSEL